MMTVVRLMSLVVMGIIESRACQKDRLCVSFVSWFASFTAIKESPTGARGKKLTFRPKLTIKVHFWFHLVRV